MDVHTPEQRRKNMKAIKAKDTKAEVVLRKAMWAQGFHYRKNYKKVKGSPDIAFTKYKVAVFCDGEFWHGKDFDKGAINVDTNKDFWNQKIMRNIERDKEVNEALENTGWTVLRFWNNDIINNTNSCVEKIEKAIKAKQRDF